MWPLANNSKAAQERADASAKKSEQRARDGAKAIAEYQAAALAVREKTARLKALRLAKEAAETEHEVKNEPAPAKLRSPRSKIREKIREPQLD